MKLAEYGAVKKFLKTSKLKTLKIISLLKSQCLDFEQIHLIVLREVPYQGRLRNWIQGGEVFFELITILSYCTYIPIILHCIW